MSRLSTIEPEGAEGAAKALLAQVEKSLGLVPNMTKVMANSPALLEGYLSLSGALAAGGLDAGVRERIAIAVAEVNKCGYCLSAHTYIGSHLAKIDEAELDAARQARSEDGHTDAILQLAAAVVRDRGEISDALFEQVRAAGVSDQEIAETVGHVAVNVLTNLFNKLAGVDNDWPVVTPYPHAA
jgi:uncharacterized peroxidase-related enzyme